MANPSSLSSNSPRPTDFGAQRSFTLPSRLSNVRTASAGAKGADADIETLFESPKCKIVSFTPPQPSGRFRTVSLDAADLNARPVGELPYGSNTERTIALGPLRVYRVPGSVAFLNSGKLVHPVLPKSACWCVDGKTKFVLGVPGNKYYRIELPCENESDQAIANDFKVVLAKIAQYETTACPFKRGFYVELPEINPSAVKRPWKPKHAPGVTSPWSPEGQRVSDGPRIERRYPSPTRTSSQSPRPRQRLVIDDTESSETDSVSHLDQEDVPDLTYHKPRVPQLVATYDEFGRVVGQDVMPVHSHVMGDHIEEPDHEAINSSMPEIEAVPSIDQQRGDPIAEQTSEDDIETANPEQQDLMSVGTDNHESGEGSEHSSSPASIRRNSTPPPLRLDSSAKELSWMEVGDSEETPTAIRPFPGMRSVTAPIYLSMESKSTENENQEHIHRLRHGSNAASLASVESSSSFHSFHSPTSPVLDSPLSESEPVFGSTNNTTSPHSPKVHKREISSNTITANPQQADMSTPTWPTFSFLDGEDGIEDDEETGTESDTKSFMTAVSPTIPQSPTLSERQPRSKSSVTSLRSRLRHRRGHSPMPSPANIYIPPTTLSGHLTNVLLHKTASLLLGPPVQLVALMLNLARRFADGKLRGESYTYGDQGQPIPCEWCDSDLDVDGNSSEEDDYGISIGGTPEKRRRKGAVQRRKPRREDSWHLD